MCMAADVYISVSASVSLCVYVALPVSLSAYAPVHVEYGVAA